MKLPPSAYNTLVLTKPPSPNERRAINLFWARRGQSIAPAEFWGPSGLPEESVASAIKGLRRKLQPGWHIALVPRKRYILLQEGQSYVPDYADEVLTPKLYARYLEILQNPGITQLQLAKRFGIKENLVRISVFLMNQRLEPYRLVIRSRRSGYYVKELA